MTTDKQARKERPIARGVLDYFPDALAEVSHVSFVGNQQHNPGEEMHWDKSKSPDHADCILRHLIERGTTDTDGLRHSAKAAWRALAMLQIEIEKEAMLQVDLETAAMSGGTGTGTTVDQKAFFGAGRQAGPRSVDYHTLVGLGCPPQVARQVVDGTTYAPSGAKVPSDMPYVYIAGPMRGYENFNFPAFDAARDRFVKLGCNVISPADIDRVAGDVDVETTTHTADQTDFAFRDFWSLYFIAKLGNPENGIVLLPGWEKSVGAAGEFFLGRWIKLRFYRADGDIYRGSPLYDYALAHCVPIP